MSEPFTIRREPRPGDLEAIVGHHREIYTEEFGVDERFVEQVAETVAEVVEAGFPRAREGIWIVERDGRHAGSVALTDDGDGRATLRWVVIDPGLRGHGLGARLVGEAVALARSEGYRLLELHTFSELTAAARIYRGAGFELRSEDARPRWGRDLITYQRYELNFQARAQSRSSPSTGSSARPFSVSA